MEDQLINYCECGCGETVGNRFSLGHQIRVHNPMWDSEVVRKNHAQLKKAMNDPIIKEKHRAKVQTASFRNWARPEYVALMKKNAYENKEWLKKQRLARQRLWKTEGFQGKQQIARMLRPNKAEFKLSEIISEYNSDFGYVGDMSYFIDGKNPDFVNVRLKKVIELFGEEFHEPSDERKRIKFFEERGWSCIVIWYLDLIKRESEVRRRLLRYCL